MDILSAAAALPFVEQWTTTTIKSELSQKANELNRTSPFAAAVVSAGEEGKGEYKRLQFFLSYCT
jgi:hypothetical protein